MSSVDNKLHAQLSERMVGYPPRSQDNVKDPLVVAKLFDVAGSATWWLTEYDPEERIAFGYVTGMACDEWGYASIDELADLWMSFVRDSRRNLLRVETTQRGIGIPRIELDRHFVPRPFSEVKASIARYAAHCHLPC